MYSFNNHIKFLTQPLTSLRLRTIVAICDDIFETWWFLAKTVGPHLNELCDEV